jgi:hypothetical protein
MPRMKKTFLVCATLWMFACGSGIKVDNTTISANSTLAFTTTYGPPTAKSTAVTVVVTGEGNACTAAVAKSVTNLGDDTFSNGAVWINFPTNATGSQTITNGPSGYRPGAASFLVRLPGNVSPNGFDDYATAGTITLTAVTATVVQGNFNVTMASGDIATGSFAADICTGLNT